MTYFYTPDIKTKCNLSVGQIACLVKSEEISLQDARDIIGLSIVQQFAWEEGISRPHIPNDWDGVSSFFIFYMNEDKLELILPLNKVILEQNYNYSINKEV